MKKKGENKKGKDRNIFRKICQIVLIICLLLGGYILWKNLNHDYTEKKIQKAAGVTDENNDFYPDWDALLKINPDTVGYIYYPACGISYPIVHTSNDTYYLDHNFYKQPDEIGSIFMEAKNKPDFSDKNTILYGHTVFGWHGMFTGLNQLTNKDFFNRNSTFIIFTPDTTYRCEIFSFENTTVNDTSYRLSFDFNDEFKNWTDDIKQQSTYVNDSVPIRRTDKVVTLSTCSERNSRKRYIVHAVMYPDSDIKSSDVDV